MIKRYSKPGDHDQLPIGTVCFVEDYNSSTKYYIQVSEDTDFPKWEDLDDQDIRAHGE